MTGTWTCKACGQTDEAEVTGLVDVDLSRLNSHVHEVHSDVMVVRYEIVVPTSPETFRSWEGEFRAYPLEPAP